MLQCIPSMTVNNQLFASLTQDKCALNLNSLLFQMSPRTPSRTLLETREAELCSTTSKLALDIPITNDLILFEYVTGSLWQVCFDSVKCLNFILPKLLAVTYDSRRRSGSVIISLVSVKQTIIGY